MSQPTVFFIGAGPGDPELLTIKAKQIIERAGLVLYAGSLVPPEVVAWAGPEAEVVDSSSLTLEQTHDLLVQAVESHKTAARVHTGDPSLYGAIAEQMRLLQAEGIAYEVVPGITAAFAAAAKAAVSFTVPEVTQSLVITRMSGRTPVPERERLRELAAHRCSLAIYLSASLVEDMVNDLCTAGLPGTTPVVIASSLGWPGEGLAVTVLDEVKREVQARGLTRQTVFLVLPGQEEGELPVSRLYSPGFGHGFRPHTEPEP